MGTTQKKNENKDATAIQDEMDLLMEKTNLAVVKAMHGVALRIQKVADVEYGSSTDVEIQAASAKNLAEALCSLKDFVFGDGDGDDDEEYDD